MPAGDEFQEQESEEEFFDLDGDDEETEPVSDLSETYDALRYTNLLVFVNI
jgi:hypothetical protein